MKLTRILCAGLLVTMLAACGGTHQGEEPMPSENASTSEAPKNIYVGRWAADDPGDPYLEVKNDGHVNGWDGCGNFTTTYEDHVDGYAKLADFAISFRACPGITRWLADGRRLTVEGDTMTVLNHAGDIVGTLERES